MTSTLRRSGRVNRGNSRWRMTAMQWMCSARSVIVCLASLALLPALASAQSAASGIAGVVKDTSGAVMPGVTVEAASPALIEKVRSVVTDGQGQFKIVDLRPGLYT